MTTDYLAGSLVRSTATFAGDDGPADPDTVVLKYQPGNAAAVTTVTYPSSPVVKDSTGVYHADLDTTGWEGYGPQWTVEWVGTGTVQGAGVDYWTVTPLPI